MSAPPLRRAYGTWPSPISAVGAAASGLRFEALQVDGDVVLWVEGRSTEQGRCAIVRHEGGENADVVDAPHSARTFVHEYGGGALLADSGVVCFSNATDGRLYRIDDAGVPVPLTPDLGDVRYADTALDARRNALVCVVEDHRDTAVVNDIRMVSLDGGEPQRLVGGNDFYASPRVSPDGTRLCWITWNQPNMPWDGTALWAAELDRDGVIGEPQLVAGGPTESIFQPSWSSESTLYFTSDRTGWWNLYRWGGHEVVPVAPMSADCGRPHWRFGMATYAFVDDGRVAITACHDGTWRLHVLDIASGRVDALELPYTSLGPLLAPVAGGVVLLAGGPHDAAAIVRIDIDTGERTVLRTDDVSAIDESILSVPEHITFPGHEGATAHAWYYRPRNDAVEPEPGAVPPLLVHAHGGPTSATSASMSAEVQYWTSLGFAYLDVDYGGSTGYGRAYRERLNGMSGIVDVGDCVAGAEHLAARGEVDASRLFITGGSAGGYIVLCAMVFHDVFKAGASLYGIADIEALLAETHKFEARYDQPYPSTREELHERSPVHFVDRVRHALLLLQGLDDPIVLPAQTDMMFEALQRAGVPCAVIRFPGEGHGFRRAENVARTLEAQLYFLCRVSGLEPPHGIEPVPIANLDG
ncbi:MAG: prolyl oligopeptidase family serine peptidase [Candidatus Dormibacteria bacterium]